MCALYQGSRITAFFIYKPMPYDIERTDSCPASKPFGVIGPNGKVHGCHPSKKAAEQQRRALYANENKQKTAIKREGGLDFPPRDFAYVPNPAQPATWRLRLTEEPGKVSLDQLQRAAAAISPAGFRGNRVEIPPAAASSVKRRLLAEFRRLKVDESEIPAAVKERDMTDGAFYTWKGKDDLIRWFTVYSNNFRDEDNPPEILSEKSHENYVTLVDHGLVDFPELWLWHIPETVWGKADWVAYADGFAMASGIVHPGFEHIAEGVAKRGKNKVSHGMPIPLIVYDPRYERTMMFHVTTEISVLPDWAAANPMTGFMIEGKGEVIEMPLPKEKRAYLKEVGMSPDLIDKIEQSLINVRQAARSAGIESKERSDPDERDDGDPTIEDDEEDVEDDDLDDDVEDDDEADGEDENVDAKGKTRRNEKVNWNSEAEMKRALTKVNWNSDADARAASRLARKVNWNSEDEAAAARLLRKVNWNSDKSTSNEKVNWNSEEVAESEPRKRRKKPPVDKKANSEKVNWNSEAEMRSALTKVNWNSEDDAEAASRLRRKVNWNSEDEAEAARLLSKVNWNSDSGGRKPRKKKEAADAITREEVADAISSVLLSLNEKLDTLAQAVGMMSKEISDLQRTDEEKIAQTKELTPSMSLTDMIWKTNPIGHEDARVKGNSALGKDKPKATKAASPAGAPTLVPMINGLISGMYEDGNGEDEDDA